MTIKRLLDSTFPWVASTYRFVRDRRKAARWQKTMTPLGIEMIGVAGMGESRFESGELALLQELLAACDVFVDVGANCGFFTLAARTAGVRCLAIEPNADNLKALLVNLQELAFTDVEVFPMALSRTTNLLPLFGGGEGASLEKGWGGMRNTYARLVPCNTLDNLVAGRFPNQKLLIKVDVEGHELNVLRGAASLVKRTPAPTWLLEHGFRENFEGRINPNFRELFELFWDDGYQAVTADSERRPVTEADVDRWLTQGARDFGYLNYLMFKP